MRVVVLLLLALTLTSCARGKEWYGEIWGSEG